MFHPRLYEQALQRNVFTALPAWDRNTATTYSYDARHMSMSLLHEQLQAETSCLFLQWITEPRNSSLDRLTPPIFSRGPEWPSKKSHAGMKGAVFLEFKSSFYQPSKCHYRYAFARLINVPAFLIPSLLLSSFRSYPSRLFSHVWRFILTVFMIRH